MTHISSRLQCTEAKLLAFFLCLCNSHIEKCLGHIRDIILFLRDVCPLDCCAHAAMELKAKLLAHLGRSTIG